MFLCLVVGPLLVLLLLFMLELEVLEVDLLEPAADLLDLGVAASWAFPCLGFL